MFVVNRDIIRNCSPTVENQRCKARKVELIAENFTWILRQGI